MSEMKLFESPEFGSVRTITEGSTTLFCGKDVASALGYVDTVNALKQHCKGVVKRHLLTTGGTQETSFLPEGDVYRLITHSKLPDAERFEHWLFDDVVPSIRKNGGYIMGQDILTDDELMARALLVAQNKIKERDRLLEEQKPLVDFANHVSATKDLISIDVRSKLARDNKIEIGRNKLFAWLRDHSILMQNNIPYQRFIDAGYFSVKEVSKETAYGAKLFTTTLVTGKGQIYIIEKLRREYAAA